jgi:uncharacterized protein YdaU (DUF1376 family)
MKDPAFLFYSADFTIGTQFLTNEQTGIYIRLLCAQHQTGHLSEAKMLQICPTKDEAIFAKFSCDPKGNYYSKRLEEEISKRRHYCESRLKNLNNQSNKSYKNASHTGAHMDNINDNINEIDTINGIDDSNKEPISNSAKDILEFCKGLPEVAHLEKPLTAAQAQLLCKEHPTTEVKDVLRDMENYKGLAKKYKSAFLTCTAWLRRREVSNAQGTTIIKSRSKDPGAAMVVHGKNFWRD